ncbi:MAG: tRNA guanosine(15) transglycosylase TgtA [Candidatus Thorarchaeota archaeon]
MYEIVTQDLHGKLGIYKMPKGDVTTPTFLPVLDPRDNIVSAKDMMDKFGFNFVITSAYLFLKRYGMPDGKKSIHEFLKFQGNVMMDSGAYQILAYGDVEIDPIQSLKIQASLETDVGVILDIPTPPTDTFQEAKEKMEGTIDRIKISLDFIKRNQNIIWTLPIQGGKNTPLIKKYIEEIKREDYAKYFGFHALGSVVPIMAQYDYITLFSMIKVTRQLLPHNIPLHLFGAGHPMIFPFIVALGCDVFDSAAYILYAKEKRYMSSTGTHHLDDLIEFPCPCEVCSRWTPKELLEEEEEVRTKKLAEHNLHVSSAEIKKIRVSLKDGRLWELLELKSKSHPKLYRAFKHILRETPSEFWELGTPSKKQIGLKIFDENSFYRPELSKARTKILRNYSPKSSKLLILITSGKKNPLEIFKSNVKIKELIKEKIENMDIVFFLPFLGLVPVEVSETYPFSQFVFSLDLSDEIIHLAQDESLKFIRKMDYQEIEIYQIDPDNIPEQKYKSIYEFLEQNVKKIKSLNT